MANTESQSQSKSANPTTPKADPANPFTAFDPMTYWAASQQMFHKAIADAYGRTEAFAGQYGAIEAQLVQRAQGAVASWAQLTQDAIAYAAQLSAEARKLGLDAIRKVSAAP